MNIDIRKIMVTTDFSETSYGAFPLAARIAEGFDAKLCCVYVLRSPDPFWIGNPAIGPVLPTPAALRAEALEHLEKVVADKFGGLKRKALAVVINGQSHLEIVEYARQNDIDMIVMATHGHTGIQGVLIGSTTERVVRSAPCPVLTVRAPEKAD
ncbi:MAG: universal stress protein [Planctomycetes bacterium]|nr:universal stress protein [Planctomycetota bacterium]